MKFRPTEFLNTPYRVSCYIKLYRKLFSVMRPQTYTEQAHWKDKVTVAPSTNSTGRMHRSLSLQWMDKACLHPWSRKTTFHRIFSMFKFFCRTKYLIDLLTVSKGVKEGK